MTTTTAKGYQYPAGTDTVTSYPPLAQNNALLEDARPGISVVTTTARNAYTGIDLWDGRIIWNTTTLQLEKYDLGTTSWIAAAAPSAVIPATSVVGPPAFGASSVVGTSTSYARADHVHGAPSIATYAPLAGTHRFTDDTDAGSARQFDKDRIDCVCRHCGRCRDDCTDYRSFS